MISILLIPAAYYAGILIARRAGLNGPPRLAARALGWLAAGAVAAAVIVGISLRVPDASAHGIQPIGRIALPERAANVCFGGLKRNRLFMAASQGLYALYVNTQGAVGG